MAENTTPKLMAKVIVGMLLQYSSDDRAEIMGEVAANEIFCTACGVGSMEHPNGDCQCWWEG